MCRAAAATAAGGDGANCSCMRARARLSARPLHPSHRCYVLSSKGQAARVRLQVSVAARALPAPAAPELPQHDGLQLSTRLEALGQRACSRRAAAPPPLAHRSAATAAPPCRQQAWRTRARTRMPSCGATTTSRRAMTGWTGSGGRGGRSTGAAGTGRASRRASTRRCRPASMKVSQGWPASRLRWDPCPECKRAPCCWGRAAASRALVFTLGCSLPLSPCHPRRLRPGRSSRL